MIPASALEILALIKLTETGRADATAYDTVFGHNERKLTKPITQMTVDELQGHQKGFTKSFGSSASGAYQFMRATLADLKTKCALSGEEIFTPELQDELGYELLRRRGYQPWIDGKTTTDTMMVGLAREWASFPVPSRMKGAHRVVQRGETYYAGDALNRALIAPDVVWLACEAARNAKPKPPPDPIPPKPEYPDEPGPADDITLTREEWQYALATISKALTNPAVREALMQALAPDTT
jgi:muramidase (phage lysozyme)